MHTSFTGSARKARQVNLSGRSNANPWTASAGTSKSIQTASTQSTLANAQADRLRRQQERDKQQAVRKIQKTWRGHSARQKQKQRWRGEWDLIEQHRLNTVTPLQYDDFLSDMSEPPRYSDQRLCLAQMRLLSRLFAVKTRTDSLRLVLFGKSLRHTIPPQPGVELYDQWLRALRKIGLLISTVFEKTGQLDFHEEVKLQIVLNLLRIGRYVFDTIPYASDNEGSPFFALMTMACDMEDQRALAPEIEAFAMTILHRPKVELKIYQDFAVEMLSNEYTIRLSSLLDFFNEPSHAEPLYTVLVDLASFSDSPQLGVERYLWMLSYLLFIAERTTRQDNPSRTWIKAVSALLSRCANTIALRFDEADQPMNGTEPHAVRPLHPFVREQISRLAQQQSVESIVQELRGIGIDRKTAPSLLAKPLANYAVALLRAFPTRALNIRMWLYRSSPPSSVTSYSTIQYLWEAAESTSVFQKIVKDHRSVLSVLTEAAPEHNQIGRPATTALAINTWQEEWRIVLLFTELYTFIFKIMDDEEFFALDENHSFDASSASSQFAQGALPLKDIARLTTFFKNLAFPLYWNAADLDETNEIEEHGGISALFGAAPVEPIKHSEKRQPKTLAGNGVSQGYLKDRVTALLRMLHERDSRRRFLPEGHWLMTNNVDMHGFIPAVVVEEERRQAADDDDREEDDIQGKDGDELESEGSLAFASPTFNSMFGIRPPHTPRTQTSRFSDEMTKRRERERKRRQAESLVPRLEILRNLPFFIPFDTRVQIFREFVYQDQFRRRNGLVDPDDWRFSIANGNQGRGFDGQPRGMELINRHHAEIRRGSVFEDAYERFYEIGEALKEPIQITFIDQFGATEAGIDGGGVTKEFLISVTGEAFEPNGEMPMFIENEQRFLFPNPKALESYQAVLRRQGIEDDEALFHVRELLRRYEFLGRVVGKCMYEGILVDLNFAGFFLLKWALTGGTTSATTETAYRASINDLRDFDEELYQGLLKLKNYRGDVESDFGLDFTASDEADVGNGHKHTWTRDLIPNGSNTPVTNANRLLYIDKITRYRLQQQPLQVTNAFLKGLGQIIQPMWLAMFNQRELQKLVGGDNAELDINDLRRNTQYGGLYVIGDDGLEHPTISLFWKVLKEMGDDDRRRVLKFVTSTPRAPLLGFGHLNPKFSIRDSSEDQTRLPSTSTCVNLLKLPRYGDETTMREKLLYAVNAGAGFDLS